MKLGAFAAASDNVAGGRRDIMPGAYIGYTDKVEIRQSKTSGNNYLNLRIALSDETGAKVGTIFTMLFPESTNSHMMARMKKALTAFGMVLDENDDTETSLKDLCAILEKQQVCVVVKTEHNEQYGDKTDIDWDNGGYYSYSEWDEVDARINKGIVPSPDFVKVSETDADEVEF